MIDEQRISQARQRVRDHQNNVQQLQGRRSSLQEQHANYVTELAKVGMTPEELPAHIEKLNSSIETALQELELALDSVGA